MLTYLIELGAHDGAGPLTIFLSRGIGYTPHPSDNFPPEVFFAPLVQSAGGFDLQMFSQNRTMGSSDVGFGELRIVNVDGQCDHWVDYGFDGRAITVKAIEDPYAPYSQAVTLIRGSVDQVDSADALDEFRVRFYDRREDLDQPLQKNRYAGTVLSGTSKTGEGTVDLKDKVKPIVIGRVRNAAGICIDPFNLVWQWSDGPVASLAVYDAAVPLTLDANYATLAALYAATIRPGRYATCLALGMARLGGQPYMAVTADVVEGATLADRSCAKLVQRIMTRMGFVAGTDFDLAKINALHALAPAEAGDHITDERTGLDAAQRILSSIGGWILPNSLGVFGVGRLSAPGAPIDTLTDDDIIGEGTLVKATSADEGGGIPTYRIILKHSPLGTIMAANEIAGCVDQEYRDYLSKVFREVKVENLAIQTKHKKSGEMTIETLLTQSTDATAEANRRFALYSVRRDNLKASVEMQRAFGYELGDTLLIKLPRFGYDNGRAMVIRGKSLDFETEQTTLDLWG